MSVILELRRGATLMVFLLPIAIMWCIVRRILVSKFGECVVTIAIVLRTEAARNVFRDTIIASLRSGFIDDALLCSGFFQEQFKDSDYRVSDEKGLAQVCSSSQVSLTTLGIHNYTWKKSYQNFRTNMMSAGANIRCLYKPGMKWHAKVFIGSWKGVPQIGIVGSSNMTRNAFSTGARWNHECDVFMWDRKSPIARIASEMADSLGDQIMVRAPYIRRMNGGLEMSQMLSRIQAEVLEGDIKELD